ncbi:hypothetical protein IKN40_04165 [bacterium]|nr:hypothetical protein [bacterium]
MRRFREISNPERRIEPMEMRMERLAEDKIYQLKNNIGDPIDNLPDMVDYIDGHQVLIYNNGVKIVEIKEEDETTSYYPYSVYMKKKSMDRLNSYLDELLH